ncbi:unnamed protein product [Prunus armeniaca]|uniref:Uncharacterized protein n=1 Tax=Prunus armeniaca TaxID=36596 RepID=A0A6J5W6Y3_PRUAR|nr:unnamed protein product [Prunus armeniaca]CAB4293978.1 unnamed protein product [Prunus armeniaca]
MEKRDGFEFCWWLGWRRKMFCEWIRLLCVGFVHGLRVVVMGEKKSRGGMGSGFCLSGVCGDEVLIQTIRKSARLACSK